MEEMLAPEAAVERAAGNLGFLYLDAVAAPPIRPAKDSKNIAVTRQLGCPPRSCIEPALALHS